MVGSNADLTGLAVVSIVASLVALIRPTRAKLLLGLHAMKAKQGWTVATANSRTEAVETIMNLCYEDAAEAESEKKKKCI